LGYSTLLAGVDGSEESIAAAKTAVGMASMNEGAEVIALHVLGIPSFAYYHSQAVTNEVIQKCRSEADVWFKQITKSSEESKVKLKTHIIVRFKPMYSEIINYTEQEKIDLIIVGTTGRTELANNIYLMDGIDSHEQIFYE
jgi:nucleotide-binding universal stress UspA family protein